MLFNQRRGFELQGYLILDLDFMEATQQVVKSGHIISYKFVEHIFFMAQN